MNFVVNKCTIAQFQFFILTEAEFKEFEPRLKFETRRGAQFKPVLNGFETLLSLFRSFHDIQHLIFNNKLIKRNLFKKTERFSI